MTEPRWQTYLVLLSWGPCRNRYYEIFKKMHYLCVSALKGLTSIDPFFQRRCRVHGSALYPH